MRYGLIALLTGMSLLPTVPSTVVIDTPMPPPAWARLERQILAASAPACREFFRKSSTHAAISRAFLRWGANDGPDDAFENFNRWPELHALGGGDEILERTSRPARA